MKTCVWFSWIIFIVAIAALCLAWFRCEPIKTEWASILVGAIGSIACAVIGWQVYNAIENTKTLKQIEAIKKELTEYRAEARQNAIDNHLHSQALKMIDIANDKTKRLVSRYKSGLNAVNNLMTRATPKTYVPMQEALTALENILTELKERPDEVSRYMFARFQTDYEDLYDSIISAMETQAKHLKHLRKRIKAIRDLRISILEPCKNMSWDDYRERLTKTESDTTPTTP